MSHVLRVPLGFGETCRSFATLTEKTVRGRYAYRVSSLLSLLANAVGYMVFVLVWRAVYAENPGRLPVAAAALFPYLLSAFALSFVLNLAVDGRVMQRVRLGLVTSDLLRPIGFMPVQLAQAVGDVITNAGMMLPLVAVGSAAFGIGIFPPTLAAFCFGLLSIALAFLVNFGISYLIVQATFLTESSYGVFFTRVALHQVFSGLSAPLALFPGPLRSAAALLPFHCVVETPVRIWLGQTARGELVGLLLTQLAWAAALMLTSGAIFNQVLKRHQIQGG